MTEPTAGLGRAENGRAPAHAFLNHAPVAKISSAPSLGSGGYPSMVPPSSAPWTSTFYRLTLDASYAVCYYISSVIHRAVAQILRSAQHSPEVSGIDDVRHPRAVVLRSTPQGSHDFLLSRVRSSYE